MEQWPRAQCYTIFFLYMYTGWTLPYHELSTASLLKTPKLHLYQSLPRFKELHSPLTSTYKSQGVLKLNVTKQFFCVFSKPISLPIFLMLIHGTIFYPTAQAKVYESSLISLLSQPLWSHICSNDTHILNVSMFLLLHTIQISPSLSWMVLTAFFLLLLLVTVSSPHRSPGDLLKIKIWSYIQWSAQNHPVTSYHSIKKSHCYLTLSTSWTLFPATLVFLLLAKTNLFLL